MSRLLGGENRRRLSRFLSGALRHFPDDVGLDLDGAGWVPLAELVEAAQRRYDWADEPAVRAVIETDPKGRYEREDGAVRAAYGHSVPVDLVARPTDVPSELYHGTAPANVAAIREEGLKPMGRQRVHLSGSIADARAVGRRHAPDPAVFVVDAARLDRAGHPVTRRGRKTYTVERVPPEFLSLFEE